MATSLFNERRAAESAAFLLHRAGGTLPLIKLMKLMYLAERLSFKRYGEALTGDRLVSMDQGPVLSRTYEHINGARRSVEGGWEDWVSDRAGHQLALRDPSKIRSPEQDLMYLSESDLEVLGETWEEFGHLDKWALVDYTHKHCPEWEFPDGSSLPIEHSKLFSALGYTEDQIAGLMERLSTQSVLGAPVQF
jgi:uncharacterized phage-associated protein